MWWYETDSNLLKLRNESDNGWINVAYVNQSTGKYEILDDTKVVNTSGTQIGILGDQTQATWQTGTSTTESLVSPAKLKAAIDSNTTPARGYIAFNGSTGGVFRSKNITLAKASTGNYTLTMDASVQDGSTNWVAIVGEIDAGVNAKTPAVGTGGNTAIQTCYVSSRSTTTITLRARQHYTSFIHQGGNDNNSAYSWGVSAVDSTYISVVVY